MCRLSQPVFAMEDYSPAALAQRWLLYTQGPDGFKNGSPERARHGKTCGTNVNTTSTLFVTATSPCHTELQRI